MENVTEYVLGFLFTPDREQVVLIKKSKPNWQKGLLNGVGGKIERNETPIHAMTREFKEETGAFEFGWIEFATLQGNDWKVYCFKAFSNEVANVETVTDEEILTPYVSQLKKLNTISNLHWLIPMCLDNNDEFNVNAVYS